MGTPIDGIAWDEMSFQVYRSQTNSVYLPVFRNVSGNPDLAPATSYLVTSYMATATTLFGELAGADLGLVPDGVNFEGFDSPSELQSDIEAALAVGIAPVRIHLFALDGVAAQPDPAAWVATPPEPWDTPPKDDLTEALRAMFTLLDAQWSHSLP
jgi:hypothetical protein